MAKNISKDIFAAVRDAARVRKDEHNPKAALYILTTAMQVNKDILTPEEKSTLLTGMSDCYRALKQYTRSHECIRDAVMFDESNVFAQVSYARILQREGDLDGARAHYMRAKFEEPNNEYVQRGLAELDAMASPVLVAAPVPVAAPAVPEEPAVPAFVPSGDLATDLRRKLELNPKEIGPRLLLAELLNRQGNTEDAAQHLWTVLERDSYNSQAKTLLRRMGMPPKRPATAAVAAEPETIIEPFIQAAADTTTVPETPVIMQDDVPAEPPLVEVDILEVRLNLFEQAPDLAHRLFPGGDGFVTLSVEVPVDCPEGARLSDVARIEVRTDCPARIVRTVKPGNPAP